MIDTIDIAVNKVAESSLQQVDFNNIVFGKKYSDHMFVADYEDGQWQDFRIIPYGPLSLSPANVTLHYGQSIFEGMKAYKNDSQEVLLFRPLDNHERLNISARRMCLAEVPEELFMGGLLELLTIDSDWVPQVEDTSLYVRPLLFATDENIGIRPPSKFRFMIITCPAGAYYKRPVKVKVETHYSRAVKGGTGFAKAAGNYAGSLYPAKLAQDMGYDQLIWTDANTHEYVEEAGTMNIVFQIGDSLVTAPTGDTILKGITRDSVLTLARDWGMNVEVRKLSVKELIAAAQSGQLKEAFGTGTAATIAPIGVIGHNGQDYNLPENRPLAQKMKKTLDEIKTGKIEDIHGWTLKI